MTGIPLPGFSTGFAIALLIGGADALEGIRGIPTDAGLDEDQVVGGRQGRRQGLFQFSLGGHTEADGVSTEDKRQFGKGQHCAETNDFGPDQNFWSGPGSIPQHNDIKHNDLAVGA